MRVSIEISTYNRKETLREVLNCLAVQTFPPDQFEVILSDDGSDDGLLDMVESMTPELPYRLKLLRHEHKGPAHAHNRGIEAAESDLVIMLAADVLATPELVAQHVKSHEEHPAPEVMVSGALVQSLDMPDNPFQRNWNRMLNRMFSSEKRFLKHGFFFVSNLSFKKEFLQRHGLFHEWPPASMEDLELGYRLKQRGMNLMRNSAALGYHYHPVDMQSVVNRAYTEGYYWDQFETHVPEIWVREKSGHLTAADGLLRYSWSATSHVLKSIAVNGFTVRLLIVPALRFTQKWNVFAFFIRVLTRLLAIHHFDKGVRDFQLGDVFNPAHSKL